MASISAEVCVGMQVCGVGVKDTYGNLREWDVGQDVFYPLTRQPLSGPTRLRVCQDLRILYPCVCLHLCVLSVRV